ncbi:MAG: TonB-dependent receptor [Chitinophagaceae bacterium]
MTASVAEKRVSETGRDIIVIKGDRFDKSPVHSIDELLRYIPGIEVQQRGPAGSQSDILMRGGTFQQVLVILDGIRLNDPLTGHFNSYIPIAPGEIDHIEILKGASSAIYGTEAVGGVISIVSKSFAAGGNSRTNEIEAGTSGGQYGFWSANASGLIQTKHTAVSIGALSDNADGVQQRGINGFFHNTTVSASVRQQLSENWTLSLRSSYDHRNFAAQNFYTAFVSDTAVEKVNTWWNQFNITGRKGRSKFSFDAGYKQAEDRYAFTKNASANDNHSRLVQALAVEDYSLDRNTSLTGGIQFINQSITSNDRGDHSVPAAGVFWVLNQTLAKNLHLSPAVRLDWNNLSGWEFVPQVNASYKWNKLVFRGSAGKTTRNADFTERFNNYNKALVTSGNIGNPDLGAEHSFSWEAGADYYFGKSLKLSATYFEKQYTGLIDWINTSYNNMPRKDNLSPSGSYYLAENNTAISTRGIETVTSVTFGKLDGMAGLTWMHTTPAQSLYIASAAKLLVNYSVSYRVKFIRLSVNGLYKQRAPQLDNSTIAQLDKNYFLLNGKLSADLYRNKLSLYIECDNLFNRQYADRFGVPMPGRWLMTGVQFKIK